MNEFGTRLKTARKNKKITQKELARQLGVGQSTVSNYEKNFRFPSAAALIEISDRLQISVDYLLGRSTSAESDSQPEASSEASGSFIEGGFTETAETENEAADPFRALRVSFFKCLLEGRFQEAVDLIMAFQNPEIDLMDYNLHVFEPILKKLGTLWEAGEVSVADEHVISDLITRLMTRLEQEKQDSRESPKPFSAALMLTGAEEHEFPLRMIEAVLKHRGWTTYYLGRSIPIASLEDFLRKNEINILGLSVTLSAHINNCEILVRTVKAMDPEIRPKIMIGGSAIKNEIVALQQLGADFYFDSQQSLAASLEYMEKKIQE